MDGMPSQARRMHPDKGGDPEKFKVLQSAYDILKDEEKRELSVVALPPSLPPSIHPPSLYSLAPKRSLTTQHHALP